MSDIQPYSLYEGAYDSVRFTEPGHYVLLFAHGRDLAGVRNVFYQKGVIVTGTVAKRGQVNVHLLVPRFFNRCYGLSIRGYWVDPRIKNSERYIEILESRMWKPRLEETHGEG